VTITSNDLNIGAAYANALLKSLHLIGVPDVFEVARELKLKVKEEALESCDGVLVRPKGIARGIIAINANIRSGGRKRFTVAHEIGHFVLPGHEGAICSRNDIEGWGGRDKERERQADEFAAELLIPSSVFKPKVVASLPCLDVIDAIASESTASLSASGWKYCDLTSERCAVVWSSAGKVVWAKRSDKFRFGIKKGKWIENGTYAYDCFRNQEVPAQPEPIPARYWLESGNLQTDALIWEESRSLPAYDSVLTMVWIKDRIEQFSDYDEDEDSALDPEDFTVFRKRWPR
jgi:hypothetical protein